MDRDPMPTPEAVRERLRALTLPGLRRDQPLRELTTIRIGGPAAATVRIRTPAEAERFREAAAVAEVPWAVLGAGSNVLADDRGFCGLLLRVEIAERERRGDAVRVGAGLPFDDLIAWSLAEGLVGLEFASGIPGTVGGAVVGNAGCYGHEIGSFVREARLLGTDGRIRTVGPRDLAFAYRTSALKRGGDILLDVVLQLRRGDAAAAGERRREHLADRRRKHPTIEPSAGSWFRNLPPAAPEGRRVAAGRLLEAVGAKAMRVGDAAVFARHANIVINLGRATAADVDALVGRMRAAVRERFGVELREEVRRLRWLPAAAGPFTSEA